MSSVMGLLEERERAARQRVEALQAELLEAEAAWERFMIARETVGLVLAESCGGNEVPPVVAAGEPSTRTAAAVPGSVVPVWRDGLEDSALAPDYRRLVDVLAGGSEPGGEAVDCRQLAVALGLEAVPAKVEGVRSKAKRLVARGWLAEERPGSSARSPGESAPRRLLGRVYRPGRPKPGGRGPAVATLSEIRSLLGEPRFNWSDAVPWVEMEREFGIEFPADFREIVNAYGSIQINGQLYLEHPAGHLLHSLRETIRGDLEMWREEDMAEFLPSPVGSKPGELMPVASATTGEWVFLRVPDGSSSPWSVLVQELDSPAWTLHEMTFSDWLLAYLRGEDVTVCSRNLAPDRPFYEPLS